MPPPLPLANSEEGRGLGIAGLAWRRGSQLSKLWISAQLWVPLRTTRGPSRKCPGATPDSTFWISRGWGHWFGCFQNLLRGFLCEAKVENLRSHQWNHCSSAHNCLILSLNRAVNLPHHTSACLYIFIDEQLRPSGMVLTLSRLLELG